MCLSAPSIPPPAAKIPPPPKKAKKVSLKAKETDGKPEMLGLSSLRIPMPSTLMVEREHYLSRYRDAAALTIPWLQPEQGHNSSNYLHVPFQSMGARGVRNLCSKLMLALIPPGIPFFRLDINRQALEEYLAETGGDPEAMDKAKTKLDEQLRKIEDDVSATIEAGSLRAKVFLALLEASVGGTSLFQIRDDFTSRVYNLQEFVLEKDPSGSILKMITVESISRNLVPEELMHLIKPDEKTVDLYTEILRLDEETYEITQEIRGHVVDTPDVHSGKVKASELPYIPIRFASIDGESYGRSLIEETIGDLAALEGLSQSFLELAAAAARTLPMVDPTGVTRIADLAGARNLTWVVGREQDVSTYTIDKRADMAAIRQEMIDLQDSLKAVFLMTASIQRNAERVTAEEIRTLSQELETTLGGVYSILAEEFQLPLVRRILSLMEIDLPEDLLSLRITTGVEGVGRGRDAQALLGFGQAMAGLYGPEALPQILPMRDAAGRLANAFGVDTTGFNTAEQIAQAAQQAAQAETMRQIGPDVAKQVMQNQQPPQQ
jgi:hypothetical protein